MISPRHAPAVCGLLALALIPTVIHSYSSAATTDGRATGAIPETLAGYHGTPSGRSATWGKRRFNSEDWLERTYLAGGDEVRLTVVRSSDPKALYHHPELAIAYGTSFQSLDTQRLPSSPDVPLYVLNPAPGVSARAMYVLHYDGRFVEDPIMFQMRTALELLFSRRKPMTIFFVLDPSAPPDAGIETLGATRVLYAGIERFLAQTDDALIGAR